jgi:hypothetical protein
VQRQPLRAEQQFGSPQHEGILAAVEDVAQDDVDKLVEKQWRRTADASADQIEIGRFQCFVAQQTIAKGNHQFPILPRCSP